MYQRQVTFQEAVVSALRDNYCNFSGRASRSQFWWFYLFYSIISFIISAAVIISGSTVLTVVQYLVILALLLPNLGLCVRRLHDIDKSGWWYLIGLIPIIGAIILLVWFCQNSQMTPNEYGPVPNVVE